MNMNIKLPVLEKDHDWKVHSDKLNEECVEVMISIYTLTKEPSEENAKELLSEVLDVIQMCIGILDKLLKAYPGIIKQGVLGHLEKLYSRGWKFKGWLRIEED